MEEFLSKTNTGGSFNINFENTERSQGLTDGIPFVLDEIKIGEIRRHIIHNNKSYNIEILSVDKDEKLVVLYVNGKKVSVNVRDKFDQLLEKMGFDAGKGHKVNDIKAPMPGMVLRTLVDEGTNVKKGDQILVLEAMKMENIIKSPCDGVIKKVNVAIGKAVEKNQVLVTFV